MFPAPPSAWSSWPRLPSPTICEARDEAAAELKRSDAAEERAQDLASSLDKLGSRLESLAARLAGGAEG